MKGGIVRALQLEVAQLEARLRGYQKGVSGLRSHLHSSKFSGQGNDWISTGDVLNWLREADWAAMQAGDNLIGCPVCGRVKEAGNSCPHGCVPKG